MKIKLIFSFILLLSTSCQSDLKPSINQSCNNKSQTEIDKKTTEIISASIRNDYSISDCARSIVVTTENGIVTLEGNVANHKEIDAILSKAQKQNCVKKVVNKLKIKNNC